MAGTYQTLPFVFGFPHGSDAVPEDLREGLALDEDALRAHCDLGLETLFDFGGVQAVKAGIHPLICDVARASDDRGERGAAPRVTPGGQPVYKEGAGPGEREVRDLIDRYHALYHAGLSASRQDEDVLMHFEVHAMRERPGAGDPDAEAGGGRPQVCLSNNGDAEGRPRGGGFLTCPTEDLVKLGRLFASRGLDVRLNDPFPVGHAAVMHGKRWYAGLERVPVIQVHLREDLWLSNAGGRFDPDKGKKLQLDLRMVLEGLADFLTQAQVEISL